MKNKILKIIIILLLFNLAGCKDNSNNKSNNNNGLDSKKDFLDNVTEIKNDIETIPNKDEYQNDYNTYYLNDDYLYGYNYNTKKLEYDHDLNKIYDYNLKNGFLVENKDNEIYLSIENKDYCAIKDFKDNDILVYDISEKSKCHITHIIDGDLILSIFSKYLDDYGLYIPGEVANRFVSLSAFNNVLDDGNCTYTWYRNGEKIEDSNVKNYVVTLNNDDADYYVEMTTYEGQKVKSKPINVKTNFKIED